MRRMLMAAAAASLAVSGYSFVGVANAAPADVTVTAYGCSAVSVSSTSDETVDLRSERVIDGSGYDGSGTVEAGSTASIEFFDPITDNDINVQVFVDDVLIGEDTVDCGTAPPTDTDGDGVPDKDDAFPNDKDESKDTDKDGVGDNADKCEGTPAGTEVDAKGCAVVTPPKEADNGFTAVADACDSFASVAGTGSLKGSVANTDDVTDKSVTASVAVLNYAGNGVFTKNLGTLKDGASAQFEATGLYHGTYTVVYTVNGKEVKRLTVEVKPCDIPVVVLKPVTAKPTKCGDGVKFFNPKSNPMPVTVVTGQYGELPVMDGTFELAPGESNTIYTTKPKLDYVAYGSQYPLPDAGSGSIKLKQDCGTTPPPSPKPPVVKPPVTHNPHVPFVARKTVKTVELVEPTIVHTDGGPPQSSNPMQTVAYGTAALGLVLLIGSMLVPSAKRED